MKYLPLSTYHASFPLRVWTLQPHRNLGISGICFSVSEMFHRDCFCPDILFSAHIAFQTPSGPSGFSVNLSYSQVRYPFLMFQWTLNFPLILLITLLFTSGLSIIQLAMMRITNVTGNRYYVYLSP